MKEILQYCQISSEEYIGYLHIGIGSLCPINISRKRLSIRTNVFQISSPPRIDKHIYFEAAGAGDICHSIKPADILVLSLARYSNVHLALKLVSVKLSAFALAFPTFNFGFCVVVSLRNVKIGTQIPGNLSFCPSSFSQKTPSCQIQFLAIMQTAWDCMVRIFFSI